MRISGTVADPEVNAVTFSFSPIEDGDRIRFSFDVVDGRFGRDLFFSHDQVGSYDLSVFTKQEGVGSRHQGEVSDIQIIQGEGVSLLPARYFNGLTLDAPLALEFSTGSAVRISGTVADPEVNAVIFFFSPIEDGDRINFYFDVVEGRFKRDIFIGHDHSGTYNLEFWVVLRDKRRISRRRKDVVGPVTINKGAGVFTLPRNFFHHLVLDHPLSSEIAVNALFLLQGNLDATVRDIIIVLESETARRVIKGSIEGGRFSLPLRLRAAEVGAINLRVTGNYRGDFAHEFGEINIRGVDHDLPVFELGVISLSLLPEENGIIPVNNRGVVPLELYSPVVEGPFEVLGYPTFVSPGDRGEIEIAYHGSGNESGVATVVSNDPLRPSAKVALSGLRPVDRTINLQHIRSGSDGMLSIPWNFSNGNFALALYSAQVTGLDTGAVYSFSIGGTTPPAKIIAAPDNMSARDEFEMILRHQEHELASRILERGWRAAKPVQANYRMGDTRNFIFSTGTMPTQYLQATVVAENEKVVAFVQDDLKPDSANIDDDQILQMINLFKDDMDVVISMFGKPSDVDGDGKVLLLFTHLVDERGSVAGFYQASSVLSVENGGNGNQSDMMFISPTQGLSFYRSLLVHEFQHLINFNQHVIVRSGNAEVSWLNEGLSHLSEDLVERGFEDGGNVNLVNAFLANPAIAGLEGSASSNKQKRGAAYLFVRSLVDRLGESVLMRLVQTGLSDRDNIENVSGEKFEDVHALWAAQLYASGNGLVEHPMLNYTFEFLQPSGSRGFPMPVALYYGLGDIPISGSLKPRGVNFVEVHGDGVATVNIKTDSIGKIGAVVLPLSGDFVPTRRFSSKYFSGLMLDEPLNAVLRTGSGVPISGTVTAPEFNEICFDFRPNEGGDDVDFCFDVVDGRFDRDFFFSHDQVGSYDLYVYTRTSTRSGFENNSRAGIVRDIKIIRGQGMPSLVPEKYFRGLTLDAPLALEFSTGSGVRISGTVADPEVNRVRFVFRPIEGGDYIRFFFDVVDGRFDDEFIFVSDQIGAYELSVWSRLKNGIFRNGKLSEIKIIQGKGMSLVPEKYFSGLILDAPLPLEFSTGSRVLIRGTVADSDVNRIRFYFRPTEDGDTITFSFYVVDGRFDQEFFFRHDQVGSYELAVYTYQEGGARLFEGSVADIQIIQGQGLPQLSTKYFNGLTLEAPLPLELRTGSGVPIGGILADPEVTQIRFYFHPTEEGDDINFFFDVVDGRFDQEFFFSPAQVGSYDLSVYTSQGGESLTWSGAFSMFIIYSENDTAILASDVDSHPEHLGLHPNFPNPFNSGTLIRYDLPIIANGNAVETRLSIYNIIGQEVRTLVDQSQRPGYHSVMWDGRDERGLTVSSGVYLYRLEVGRQTETRRLLLLR